MPKCLELNFRIVRVRLFKLQGGTTVATRVAETCDADYLGHPRG